MRPGAASAFGVDGVQETAADPIDKEYPVQIFYHRRGNEVYPSGQMSRWEGIKGGKRNERWLSTRGRTAERITE